MSGKCLISVQQVSELDMMSRISDMMSAKVCLQTLIGH